MSKILLLVAAFLPALLPAQPDSLYLYEGSGPGAKPSDKAESWIVNPQDGVRLVKDVQRPQLYVHHPARPSGASVLICPGGGYFAIALDHEGHQLARWFTERGITAFVLKYRLPSEELMSEPHMRPLQDAQQALRLIRRNAAGWGLDPGKVGIMGFSAGGHLAATAGTHFGRQVGELADPSVSVRPDFMILIYPMISFELPLLASGEANALNSSLLGENPSPELIREYSNEHHVSPETPPTFLLLAADDFLNPGQSMAFFEALRRNQVPAELHVYGQGGHGFSLTQRGRGHVEQWDGLLEGWLRDRRLYQPFDAYERRSFRSSSGFELPYRILYPEGYDPQRRYPLVLFLHGRGESGKDNEKQLTHVASRFLDPAQRRAFPAIVVFPQCPEESYWAQARVDRSSAPVRFEFDYTLPPTPPLAAVMELMSDMADNQDIDPQRIYVTGLSMGGMGSFEIAHRMPGFFAAAAPVCGAGDAQRYGKSARDLPFWIFHGDADAVVSVEESRAMAAKLRALKAPLRYTEYPGVNHNSWDYAYAEPALWVWMFEQRRK
jgi:acetyl esterase/lipase